MSEMGVKPGERFFGGKIARRAIHAEKRHGCNLRPPRWRVELECSHFMEDYKGYTKAPKVIACVQCTDKENDLCNTKNGGENDQT